MYCPYCGTKCEDTHRFCFQCGKELPVIEEEQQPEIPEAVTEISAPTPHATAETVCVEAAEAPDETVCAEDTEAPGETVCVEAAEEAPAEDLISNEESAPAEEPVHTEETTPIEEPAESLPPPKKGRLWPPVVALVSMVCVGLLVFFLFPFQPVSTSGTPWFFMEDGKLYFDPSLYTGGEELTIPETVDGETVTYIGEYAFYGCSSITSVILPETVTRIGEYAFSDCDSLRGIYIPESVTRISNHAFYGCDDLEAIYINGTLNHMGDEALGECTSLKYILFDGTYSQWTDLYDGAFITEVELHAADGTYHSKP